jgi:hypothetical protein
MSKNDEQEPATKKNYTAIVKMVDGDTLFPETVTKNGDDYVFIGHYKDGKGWKVTTTKSQVSSVKEDLE